jgi:hypothetical protein
MLQDLLDARRLNRPRATTDSGSPRHADHTPSGHLVGCLATTRVDDEATEEALRYLADTGIRALLAGTLSNNLRDAAKRAVLGLLAEDASPLKGWQDIFGPDAS